ncbi:GspH/FimT family pseudopilin [Candidatus Sumerlaeota bacterium]|nr:GspH/FimT family pseudopilin [Candidatus Sumerlaeota bacterium]
MHGARNRTGRSASRGMTMIEIVVVVVILGMLLAVAAPSMKHMLHRGQLRGEARNLVSLLKYARNEAVSRNQLVELHFDLREHVYRLDLMLDGIPANVREEDEMRVESEERVIELPSNDVQFTAVVTYEMERNRRYKEQDPYLKKRNRRSSSRDDEDDADIVTLRFYPRGTATGASIVLQSVKENRDEEKFMTVELYSTTGRVEVHNGKPDVKTDEDISQLADENGSGWDQSNVPYYRRKNR